MTKDKKILVSETEYKFLISQNEQLKIQNKQLQAVINSTGKYVKILNDLQKQDSYTGESYEKTTKEIH